MSWNPSLMCGGFNANLYISLLKIKKGDYTSKAGLWAKLWKLKGVASSSRKLREEKNEKRVVWAFALMALSIIYEKKH